MNKRFVYVMSCLMLLVFLPSCLTVEKKEYRYKLRSGNTGELSIRFINIMSVKENEGDLEKDFNELIETFVDGNEVEKEYPFAKLISKRLYEDGGKLCGELKFEFKEISAVNLFQYNEDGPIMYSLKNNNSIEEYTSSNGNYGGEIMPVVFWDQDIKLLNLTTSITQVDETCISLLDKFKNWKSKE